MAQLLDTTINGSLTLGGQSITKIGRLALNAVSAGGSGWQYSNVEFQIPEGSFYVIDVVTYWGANAPTALAVCKGTDTGAPLHFVEPGHSDRITLTAAGLQEESPIRIYVKSDGGGNVTVKLSGVYFQF